MNGRPANVQYSTDYFNNFLSPLKPQCEVVKYRVSYKCLNPPGAYLNSDGFYDQNPVRRVRPRLMEAPTGFYTVYDESKVAAVFASLMAANPFTTFNPNFSILAPDDVKSNPMPRNFP